jgi:uncharacterized Tic20 family protein
MEIMDPQKSTDERNWDMFCHLAALAMFIIPFGNVIGPLVVWSIKKDQYPSVNEHGKEALNFQISMLIYMLVSAVLIILLVGIFLLIGLGVLNLVLIIVASVRANAGESFKYPLSITFIQ